MAFASDSTPAPADHRALLIQRVCASATAGIGRTLDRMAESRGKRARDARGRYCKRSALADLAPADEADLYDAIGALLADVGIDRPELPPEPLLAAASESEGIAYRSEPDALDAIRSDLDALVADHIGNSDVVPNYPDAVGVVAEPPTALAARTLHLRRQLAAAVDHGADLLASLGLPRPVGPDHIVVDPEAVGAALDTAIAALDALDGDPEAEDDGTAEAEPDDEDGGDAEPWLASPERHPTVPWAGDHRRLYVTRGRQDTQVRWADGGHHDGEFVNEDGDTLDEHGEHDTADHELSLGWTAKVDQVHLGQDQDDHEVTALERHGLGFFRSGPDDAEDELGDEHTPEPAVWVFGPSRAEGAHA